LFVPLLFIGCKGEPLEEMKFGYEYLPLTIGSQIEYDVDSIVYDDFSGVRTTYEFVLRERIVEVYDDLNQRKVYRVERAKRASDTTDFRVYESYGLLIDGTRLEKLRDNLRTIPLVFPVRDDVVWDGNALNAKARVNYRYDYVDRQVAYSGIIFDSTLRVLQWVDTTNLIEKRFSEERYAKGLGLVYKEFFEIETNFDLDSGLHWIQTIRP